MIRNQVVAVAALSLAVNAMVVTKKGRRYNEHPERETYHPFLGLADETHIIHYPDEKAFSVRLTEVELDEESRKMRDRLTGRDRLQAVAD